MRRSVLLGLAAALFLPTGTVAVDVQGPALFVGPLPAPGVVGILHDGTAPTPFADPSFTCAPLTWDGASAELHCAPAAPPPPGASWACASPRVDVLMLGRGSVTGSASCSAAVSFCSAWSNWLDFPGTFTCTGGPGPAPDLASRSDFPVVCRADTSLSENHAWLVECRVLDSLSR